MRYPRIFVSLLLLLAMLSVPLRGTEPIDPDVIALREAAWRAWFAGDEAALRAMLPEDFLGIGWDGTEISNRAATIESSRGFKESGGRLVSLFFSGNPCAVSRRHGRFLWKLRSDVRSRHQGRDGPRATDRGIRQTRRQVAPSWLAPRHEVMVRFTWRSFRGAACRPWRPM